MRSMLRLAGLAALGIAFTGCPVPSRGDRIWQEDFETLCDGVPCGWVQTGGAAGSARWIETVAGEHGIQLSGDGVSIRGPAGDPLNDLLADEVAIQIVARCDAGAVLQVNVTLARSDGAISTFTDVVSPDSEWSAPLPDQALLATDGDPGPWRISRVLGVSVLKNGPGSCEIGRLAVRAVSFRS